MFKDSAYIISPLQRRWDQNMSCNQAQTQQHGENILCGQWERERSEYLLHNKINYKKMAFKIMKKSSSEGWDKQKPFLTARLYQALTRESW